MISEQPRPVDPVAAATHFVTRLGCTVFPVWGSREGKCLCGDPHDGTGRHAAENIGKHPSTTHGFKDATDNPAWIRTFLGNPGTPNYGINPPPGVLVFDVDGEGVADWVTLERQHGRLPLTLTTLTANGRHYFFRWPDHLGPMPKGKLWGFVIRRHDDGYIIGPGSVHPSGFVYDTLRQSNGFPYEIAELPEAWAKAALTAKAGGQPFLVVGERLPKVGGRHDWLRDKARLYAGAVRDPIALKAAIMAENARLEVPKSEAAVDQAIGEVLAKFAPDPVETDPETGETIRVVEPSEHYEQLATTSFPEPVHPAAFGGLAGEVAKAIAEFTDASEVGLLASLLAIAGGALGARGVYHTEHPSAVMTGLVGVTSDGRKSTTIEIAWNAMLAVGAEYDHRFDGLNSGEALVARLQKLKKEGRAHGVLVEDEFSRLLVSSRREGSTLDAMLRTAFDGRALSVFTRSSAADLQVAPPYAISAVSAITPRELRKLITPTMLVNGSVNRWMWVPVVRRDIESDGDALVVLPPGLSSALLDARDFARELLSPVGIEREAAVALNDYGRWLGRIEGLAGDMGRRLNVIAYRVALIHALLDRSRVVSIDHVERAIALAEYSRSGLGWVFGQLTGTREADLVARAVSAAGSEGLSMTEVTRKLIRNPVTRQEAIDSVVDLGLVRIERQPNESGTGRPLQKLFWSAGESWVGGSYFHYFHKSRRMSKGSPEGGDGSDNTYGINGNNSLIELNTYREERVNNPSDDMVDSTVDCAEYSAHQDHHRRVAAGYACERCHPEAFA